MQGVGLRHRDTLLRWVVCILICELMGLKSGARELGRFQRKIRFHDLRSVIVGGVEGDLRNRVMSKGKVELIDG